MISVKLPPPTRVRFDEIDAKREGHGVSVAGLCRAANVSENAYFRLKNETTRTPNFRTVNRLEHALDAMTSKKVA
jgi:transcriptional regulator with XRE-family HTH domain